jgi:UDP-N-acetylmuramate--alanine ligase
MHIYFSGIGGTGIGPLALIAQQAGYHVSGSDKQESNYTAYLRSQGIAIAIGQDGKSLRDLHAQQPVDWMVYSSALVKENPQHPELIAAAECNIKTSKRDELINYILAEKHLKMIAIAGTHGKTTTTAMAIWLCKQLDIPVSYSVGAKISFGEMGAYDPASEYFIYEADEYDRNFLFYDPYIALIPGIGYDHPDTYPTQQSYDEAFTTFICGVLERSGQVFGYDEDIDRVYTPGVTAEIQTDLLKHSSLAGEVNRKDALLVAHALAFITHKSVEELYKRMNDFPGVSRRFEKIADYLYSDYAHTPEKIRGALQLAEEVAGNNVVVVYEGLHNTRQHFIKDELPQLFAGVKKLYIVPSYLAREDETLELLTPEKLCSIIKSPSDVEPAQLNDTLISAIHHHLSEHTLVLCVSAGGGGSLDEWLRENFTR